jgi:hypothetical protein
LPPYLDIKLPDDDCYYKLMLYIDNLLLMHVRAVVENFSILIP